MNYRNLYSLISVLIIFSNLMAQTGSSQLDPISTPDGWVWKNPMPFGGNFEAVEMLSSTRIMVGGDHGVIVRSVDAGATWQQATVPEDFLSAVTKFKFYSDLLTGYAISGGILLATTDGGLTWEYDSLTSVLDSGMTVSPWAPQSSGTANNLYGVYFTDTSSGWSVGDGGTIRATTNGGSSWFGQTSGTVNDLYGVYFADTNTGWAVGQSGKILATVNAGATWTTQTSGTVNDLYGVYFADTNTGWAVGDSGAILGTIDGGTTWTTQTSDTSLTFYDVHFADAGTGWAVGDSGLILGTTDGGTTWTGQSSGISTPLQGVHFVDAVTGWTVGLFGIILATTDGGATWTIQTGGPSSHLLDVHFVDPDSGRAVGSNGTILVTADGGVNWAVEASGTGEILYGIHLVATNTGWVTGDAGAIMAYSGIQQVNFLNPTISGISGTPAGDIAILMENGANSVVLVKSLGDTEWLPIFVPPAGFTGMTGIEYPLLWKATAIYSGSFLVKTFTNIVDVSYAPGSSHIYYYLAGTSLYDADGTNLGFAGANPEDIITVGESDAYVVGDNIYRTTLDATALEDLGSPGHLNMVDFSSSSTGFAVGDDSRILATINSGNFWTLNLAQTSSISAALNLDFHNSKIGYIQTSPGSATFRTQDGGENWQQLTAAFTASDSVDKFHVLPDESQIFRLHLSGNFYRIDAIAGTSQLISSGVKDFFISSERNSAYPYHGWYVTGNAVYKSDNSGLTWTLLNTFSGVSLNTVYFVNDSSGYVGGELGLIFRFDPGNGPGGADWIDVSIAGVDVNGFWVDEPDVAVVAADEGTLFFTTDGGTIWTPIDVPTNEDLHSLIFFNPDTGYVVTSAGLLYTLNATDGVNATFDTLKTPLGFSANHNRKTPSLQSLNHTFMHNLYAKGDSFLVSTDFTTLPAPILIASLPDVSARLKSTDTTITLVARLEDHFSAGSPLTYYAIPLDYGFITQVLSGAGGTALTIELSSAVPDGDYQLVIVAEDALVSATLDTINLFVSSGKFFTALPDVAIPEDDTLVIELFAIDPLIDSTYVFSASSAEPDINVTMLGRELTLIPAEDWNGSSKVTVTATDPFIPEESLSEIFLLTVIPVQDQVKPFSLIGPTHKSVIRFDLIDPGDSITFSWQPALDVDGDLVTYNLIFSGFLYSLTEKSLNVTVVKFAAADLMALLQSFGLSSSSSLWNVHANDGFISVSADNGPDSLVFSLGPLAVDGYELLPTEYALQNNFPNPFNPVSNIPYALPEGTDVLLVIRDLLGREILRAVDGHQNAGYHQFIWDGTDTYGKKVSSGIYIARLVTPAYSKAIKMVLLK